jgi:hypothetical protein
MKSVIGIMFRVLFLRNCVIFTYGGKYYSYYFKKKKKQRLIDLGHFLTQNSKASQEALDLADKRIKELEV